MDGTRTRGDRAVSRTSVAICTGDCEPPDSTDPKATASLTPEGRGTPEGVHVRERSLRGDALALLGSLKARAVEAGDLALAKRVHTWEGELVESTPAPGGAAVVELAARRDGRR